MLFTSILSLFLAATLVAEERPALLAKADLQGAWSHQMTMEGEEITEVLLFSGDYFTWTRYHADDGAFIMTKGGNFEHKGNKLTLHYEFHTKDEAQIGQEGTLKTKMKSGQLQLTPSGADASEWQALDAGESTALTGPWLFSGRRRDGEIQRRNTDQPRKTMKILTGNRFQWIAYNTETGEFFGTGGGTYSAEDGKYTENILFFSRDDSRVGAQLEFDFRVEGDDWHHSGFSSKGDPMYEIWSKRKD